MGLKLSRRTWVLGLATWAAPGAPPGAPPLDRAIFQGINQRRMAERLRPLVWDHRLASVALGHSRRMSDLDFFSHQDRERGDLTDRLRKAGIPWRACAENIYQQLGMPDPARRAVESWMKSPGHRHNILTPAYSHTGVGVFTGRDGSTYVTQVFLTPPAPNSHE
jgi:uncharacterized protein YkwD